MALAPLFSKQICKKKFKILILPGLYISIFPAQNNARSNIPANILDIILVSIGQNIQYWPLLTTIMRGINSLFANMHNN